MRLELTPEEIPAAIDRLVDDKHQKELEDLLLKLYEQKCVELKEEVLAMMEEKVAKQQELRKAAEDRKRGIDALISREHEPSQLKKLENKKKEIDQKLEEDIAQVENDFARREAIIMRDVQKRTQDREVKYLAEITEKQREEKQEIFNQHLPDSLMAQLNEDMAEEDKKQMQVLKDQLEKQNADKLAEMDAKQAELERALTLQKNELDKLGDLERQLMEKESRRNKIDALKNRDKSFKMDDSQRVQKLLDEYEKGQQAQDDAWHEERKRQFEELQAKMEQRKEKVAEARRKREEERLAKEQAEKLA